MLKVANVPDPRRNLIAPTVYFDGFTIENGSVYADVMLFDSIGEWMIDEQLLNNTYVYVKDDYTTQKKLLKNLKLNKKIENNSIKDQFVFKLTGSSTLLTAWCGNEQVEGIKTSENIINNGQILQSSFNGTEFEYVNKIKNLDLLNFDVVFTTGSTTNVSSPLVSDLFVSDRPDKRSILGFIFNLQTFLENNSPQYNILKNNVYYRQKILANSSIDLNKSYFSKRNLTNKDKEHTKINSNLETFLISSLRSSFLISAVDDNQDLNNKSYYEFGYHLEIKDYSSEIISQEIKKQINEFINTLISYKRSFEQAGNDSVVEDIQKYIFENAYQPLIDQGFIGNFVNRMAPICSLFSGKEQEQFVSLFVSMIHPLTTTPALLERLITFTQKILASLNDVLATTPSADGLSEMVKNPNKTFDYVFKIPDSKKEISNFNYDYDAGYGFTVIRNATLSDFNSLAAKPANTISTEEFEVRKLLEARKFAPNVPAVTRNTNNFYSICNIFLKDIEYDLLLNPPQTSISFYDKVFIDLKNYNELKTSYREPETYFFHLFENDITVKTISSRNNNSTNNLIKNTLFDSNRDTADESLKFLSDTGIRNLFYLTDDTKFINFTTVLETDPAFQSSIQFLAATGSTEIQSVYPVNFSDLNNLSTKTKNLVYYNTIYKIILQDTGDLLDVYKVQETLVNPIFNSKLRLFDNFFCVLKSRAGLPVPEQPVFFIDNDVRMNVPSNYLNRNVLIAAKVLITTNDI
jgi:hypothetical protein